MQDYGWIKDALAAQGLTQRDLAKRWKKAEASVTRFLAGTENQNPKFSEMVDLAEMLGMSLDELARRMGFRAVGRAGLPPLPQGAAPRLGTISMVPSEGGLRVLLHLDLPATVAAQVVALLQTEQAK